jgi:hypothetical protein
MTLTAAEHDQVDAALLCEAHDRLTGNVNFQDNLLNVLLTRDLPWEEPQSPGGPGSKEPPSVPAEPAAPRR